VHLIPLLEDLILSKIISWALSKIKDQMEQEWWINWWISSKIIILVEEWWSYLNFPVQSTQAMPMMKCQWC